MFLHAVAMHSYILYRLFVAVSLGDAAKGFNVTNTFSEHLYVC
uniref:Uncharacterized protein n=1 Tax=Anguilla anguilla TaxID=7936 RepID=A0A0E9Y182_ANGAN